MWRGVWLRGRWQSVSQRMARMNTRNDAEVDSPAKGGGPAAAETSRLLRDQWLFPRMAQRRLLEAFRDGANSILAKRRPLLCLYLDSSRPLDLMRCRRSRHEWRCTQGFESGFRCLQVNREFEWKRRQPCKCDVDGVHANRGLQPFRQGINYLGDDRHGLHASQPTQSRLGPCDELLTNSTNSCGTVCVLRAFSPERRNSRRARSEGLAIPTLCQVASTFRRMLSVSPVNLAPEASQSGPNARQGRSGIDPVH